MNPRSITEMLLSLKSGRTTVRQLAQSALERSRLCATELNAFAAISDNVMEDAGESARRYVQGNARPLEGIPLAVKDIIDTEGMETRYGSAASAGHVPVNDASAVRCVGHWNSFVLPSLLDENIGLDRIAVASDCLSSQIDEADLVLLAFTSAAEISAITDQREDAAAD